MNGRLIIVDLVAFFKLLTKERSNLEEALHCLPSFVSESPTQQEELPSSQVGTHFQSTELPITQLGILPFNYCSWYSQSGEQF